MNSVNKALEELVIKAGVPTKVKEDSQQIVCDDEWTEEREKLAQELLNKDTSAIPEFWQSTRCFKPAN